MKLILGLALAATCLLACKKQNDRKQSDDAAGITVTLSNCGYADSVGMPPTICFEALVEESRCPINANCVWKGVAVGRFSLRLSGVQHQFLLATTKSPGRPSTDTTVAGYHIRLVNITPYPGPTTTEPTRAILKVTR
ncbi:MAG TPA: hypothetical protein VER36_02535 [Flavisolibacter sp.]|nr:hypothetical protein [Flavisolibacter sp.]